MIWALAVLFLTTFALVSYRVLSTENRALIQEAKQNYKMREALIEKDFRFRIKELKRRHQSGLLSDTELEDAIRELKQETASVLQRASDDVKSLDVQASHWTWMLALMLVALLAGIFFYQTGVPESVARRQQLMTVLATKGDEAINELEQIARHKNDSASILDWLTALRLNIELRPMEVEAWLAYVRANLIVDRHELAWQALKHAEQLAPTDARVRLAKAQLLYAKGDEASRGRADVIIKSLIAHNPNNFDALLIGGFGAFRAHDYQSAIDYWQRALALVQAGTERARLLQNSIATARARLQQASTDNQMSSAGLSIQVRLSEQAKKMLTDKAAIYVIARPEGGSRIPIAVSRMQVTPNQPVYDIRLDDRNAMRPSDKLSAHERVQLTIKLSPTGAAEERNGPSVTLSNVSTSTRESIQVEL